MPSSCPVWLKCVFCPSYFGKRGIFEFSKYGLMFLLFRKEDGGKMFLFLTFCEVFFFFVTSSPTLLLMINRESFNRHQDWLERRPGQSQAQMRKKEGRAQGCHPLPKQGNRWRNFVLREKLFSSKTDEVGTTYPQGKKKRSGPKHTWQRDLQADKPLGHSSKWPLLRKKQERLQCSRTG